MNPDAEKVKALAEIFREPKLANNLSQLRVASSPGEIAVVILEQSS